MYRSAPPHAPCSAPAPSPRLKLFEAARAQDVTLPTPASDKKASSAHVPAPVRFHGVIVPDKPETPIPVLPPPGSVADSQYSKFVAQWRDSHQSVNPEFDKFLVRQRSKKLAQGGTNGIGSSDRLDHLSQREKVFGKDPFVPVPRQQAMEKIFANDLRAHVKMSSLRVAFCRRGGKFQDEGFEPLAHQSDFTSHVNGTYHRELVERRARLVSSAGTARSASTVDRPGETLPRKPSEKSPRQASRPQTADRSAFTQQQSCMLTELTPPIPTASVKIALPPPWTCVIAHFEVQDVVQGKISHAKEKQLRPPQHLVEEYKQLFIFMCVSDEDFGRMVDYRKQPVEKLAESVHHRVQAQVWMKKEGVAGALLHEAFNRFVDVSLKDFYTNAAAEVQRWITDRDRLYEMKFRAMNVEDTTIIPLDSMLFRTKSTIATALKMGLSDERNRTKHNFVALFSSAIHKNFSQLSAVAMQLLASIESCFVCSSPLSPVMLTEILDSIPTEGLFASDVMSIVYSLFAGLCVPEKIWLSRIRDRMKFSISSRAMIDLPDDPANLSWVFRLDPNEIGKSLIQWLCSAKLFAAVAAAGTKVGEVSTVTTEQILHFVSRIPKSRLLQALDLSFDANDASGKKAKQPALQELRNSVATQVFEVLR